MWLSPSLKFGSHVDLSNDGRRLLVHVAEGPLDGSQPGGDELYSFFRTSVDWPSLLRPGQTFSVQASKTCLHPFLAGLTASRIFS